MRDRTFLGRIRLALIAVALAAFGGGLPPVAFVALLAAAVLAQLVLDAFTPRVGQRSIVSSDVGWVQQGRIRPSGGASSGSTR
jgi:hypothetical protein